MFTGIIEEHLTRPATIRSRRIQIHASGYVLIQVTILLAVVLPFIGRPYWDDELFSVRTSSGMSIMLETFRLYENNMALYYWMLYGWIKLFGISEIATRSLSLVFAVCSIISYHRLGSRFFSPVIVFLSGFVLMLNPQFLVYSIEARSYSLLVLLAIVSTNLFFGLLNRKSSLLFLLYGLSLSASIYTHYFGVLILPVHALAVFFWKRWPGSLKYFFATWFLVVLSVTPLAIFRPSSVEQVNWMSTPTVKTAIMAIPHLFGSIGIMLLIMGLWFYFRVKEPSRLGRTGQDLDLIALLWIFLPVGLAYLVSIMVKPVFMDRYFLGSLPAAALLAAHVLARGKVAGWRFHWLLLLLLAIQAFFAYKELNRKGSGFDRLTAYIGRHASERDMVIAYPFFRADHYMHFLQREAPGKKYLVPKAFHTAEYLPGGGGRDPDPDLRRLDSMSSHYERSFLICNPATREADGRQNRIWQPEIEKVLSRHFNRRDTIVFRPEYSVPLRLIIYSR